MGWKCLNAGAAPARAALPRSYPAGKCLQGANSGFRILWISQSDLLSEAGGASVDRRGRIQAT